MAMDVDVRDYHENLEDLDDHHRTHKMQQSLSASSMYAYDNLAYQVSWDYDTTITDDGDDDQDNEQLEQDTEHVHRTFGFLETIEEETPDEVDVSDYSGVWCWGDDLTDGADSVIHVLQETPPECSSSSISRIQNTTSSCQQSRATDAVLAYLESLVNHAEQVEMDRGASSADASGEFSGEESFSSWSDAIDAYLMSLATSGSESKESRDLASLVGPTASIETREAIRDLILKELESAEFRNEFAYSANGKAQHDLHPFNSGKYHDFDVGIVQNVPKTSKSRSRLVGVRSAPDLTDSKRLLQNRSSVVSRVECDRTVYDLTAFVQEACGQSVLEDDDLDSLECHHRSQSEPCINNMDYWSDTKCTSFTNLAQMSAVSSRIVVKSRSLDCSECGSTCSSTEDMVGNKTDQNIEYPSSSGSGPLKSFGSFDKLNHRSVDFKMETYLVGGTNAPPSSEDLSEDSGYSDLGYYLATNRSINGQQSSLEGGLHSTSVQTSKIEDSCFQKVRQEIISPVFINNSPSVTTVTCCDDNTAETAPFTTAVVSSLGTLNDTITTTIPAECTDICFSNDYRNLSTISSTDPDLFGDSVAPETELGVPVRKRANSGGALLSDNSDVASFQQKGKEEKEENSQDEIEGEVKVEGEGEEGGGADKGGTASAPWAKKHLQVGHSAEWEWACEDHNSFLDSIQTTTPTLPVALNRDEEQPSASKSLNNFNEAMDPDDYTNSEQRKSKKQKDYATATNVTHVPPKTQWYMDFESPGGGLDAAIFSVMDDYDDDNPDGCLSIAGVGQGGGGGGTGGACPDNEKWGGSQPNLDDDDNPSSGRRSAAYYRRSFSEDCLSSTSGGDQLRAGITTLQALHALHDADWWDAERVSDNTNSSPTSSCTSSIPCLSQGSPVDQDTDGEMHEVEEHRDNVHQEQERREELVSGCDNTNAETNIDTNCDTNAAKPPLPPQRVIAAKSRVIDARKRFFNPNNPATINKRPSDFTSSEEEDDAGKHRSHMQETLEGYRQRAQRGRERVARSVHDLSDIERNFNQEQEEHHGNCNSGYAIDRWASTEAVTTGTSNAQTPYLPHSASASPTAAGYIETDIDTLVSREVLNVEWNSQTNGLSCSTSTDTAASIVAYKTRSLFNLVGGRSRSPGTVMDESTTDPDHFLNARSMEFLLNEDNMANALPPENRLMMRTERASARAATGAAGVDGAQRCLSEHELRVRRSLQNLDLPKWYVNYVQKDGSQGMGSRRDSGSSSSGFETRPERWQDVRNRPSSKPFRKESKESLFLDSPVTPSTNDNSPLHVTSRYSFGGRSLTILNTPASRSDSPTSVPSTMFLNTRSRTPSINSISSQNHIAPYLGWRTPRQLPVTSLSYYPGPHERLSNNPGYHAYPRPGSSAGRVSTRYSEGEGSICSSDGDHNRLGKSSSVVSKHDDVFNSSRDAVPEINVSGIETSLEEVVREIGKLTSLNGSQELSQQQDHSDTVVKSTDSPSPTKSQKQQVFWMESSFLGPRPDKKLASETDAEAPEENVSCSTVPKTIDGLAHTVTKIMEEMDSADTVHAVPCHSSVDLVDVMDSLLGFAPRVRSQSSSKSPSPTKSASPTPPLPMQPPPSATAARVFSMMFEPGDNSPPPYIAPEIFQSIDIVTSSPKSPTSPQKQRHSSSSSFSSDSSHTSNDCDVTKSSTEQPPISPKPPAVAENRLVTSSNQEIEQSPLLTISSDIESFLPEVSHRTKEDSSDDEAAKAPIILQTPNFDILNSSQEADDDPKESIQSTTDGTVFSLPHTTITYHINDDGFQPGEISVAQESQESSTSEDDDDEDKLKSPAGKLATKSGSSDSDSDDAAPVVLIKPPLYVDDAIYNPTTSTPAHSMDVVQLNDEKFQPEDLPEKQEKHPLWYDELKSTVRQRRSKSASSDSSNENDVTQNMPTEPTTDEIVVIAPIKNDEWYNELKSTVRQRRSKSGSSESSNEVEATANVSVKSVIQETVVISPPPPVISQSEVLLNEEASKPEIGPIILQKEVHSSSSASDEENKSSMCKLDSSLSSNETHKSSTKSTKHSVTFLPSLVKQPVEGDSLDASFDSSNSDITPLVTVRPYVHGASFFTPVLITRPAHSNDVVLVNTENFQSDSQLAVVHGSSSDDDDDDDESQSDGTLQHPKPDSSNLQITTSVASPKTVQPSVEVVVQFLPPPTTKPPPSTIAVSAADIKFQPDNAAPAVNHKGHFIEKPWHDSDSLDSSIDTHDELRQPIKAKVDVTFANIRKYQSEDYPGLSSMISSVVRNKKDSSDDESLTNSPVITRPKMDTEPVIVPIVSMKPSVVVTDIPPDTVSLAKEKINLHNITGQSSPPPPVSVKQDPSIKEKSRKFEKRYQPGKFVTMASIDKSAAHNREEESDDDETIKSLTDLLPSPCDSSTSSDDHEVFASNKLEMKETHFHSVSAPNEEIDSAPMSRNKRPGFSPPPPPATDPPPKQPVITAQTMTSTAASTNKLPESNGKDVKNSTSDTKATDSHSDTDEDNEANESAVILRRAGVKRKEAFTLSRMTLASTNTDVHSLNSTRHSTFMGSMPELTCNRKSLTEFPVDETIQVRCTSPFCPNIVPLEIARKTYKTCHNCAVFYCSRECRRSHWDRHKKQCMYGKVKLVLKQVLKKVVDDKAVHNELSRSARAGFLSHERGFVKLIFRNSELALKFVKHGVKALQDFPIYVGWRDLIPQETGSDVYQTIIDLCQRYKPDTRMVVLAAVCVTKEIPVHAIPQWERQIVARCAKLHLSKSVISDFKKGVRGEPYMMVVNGSEALVQARGHGAQLSPKKVRKVCFEGIQAQLWERGVRLDTHHPEAYEKLKAYVDRDEPFEPIIIEPRDGRTGRTFMCLITTEMSNSSASVNTSQKSFSSHKSKEKTRF